MSPSTQDLLYFNKPRQQSRFGTEVIPRHGVYPKALPALSSLSMQCLDLGHLVSVRQSTERLPSKDTAGGTYFLTQLEAQKFSEVLLWQAAPRTHVWEEHTKHLGVFYLLALALRIRDFRAGSLTQLGTTCSQNRSHSILSLNFSYSCNLLQKCAHFLLEFSIKDFKGSFFLGVRAYHYWQIICFGPLGTHSILQQLI